MMQAHMLSTLHTLQCHQCKLLNSEGKLNFYNCSLVIGIDVWLKVKPKQNIKF